MLVDEQIISASTHGEQHLQAFDVSPRSGMMDRAVWQAAVARAFPVKNRLIASETAEQADRHARDRHDNITATGIDTIKENRLGYRGS